MAFVAHAWNVRQYSSGRRWPAALPRSRMHSHAMRRSDAEVTRVILVYSWSPSFRNHLIPRQRRNRFYFHPPVTTAPHRALGCDARRFVELEGTTGGRGKRLTFLPSAGALLQLAGDLLVARDLTSVSGRQRVADDAAPIDDEEPHVVVGQELGQLAEERLGRPKVVRRRLRLHPL